MPEARPRLDEGRNSRAFGKDIEAVVEVLISSTLSQ